MPPKRELGLTDLAQIRQVMAKVFKKPLPPRDGALPRPSSRGPSAMANSTNDKSRSDKKHGHSDVATAARSSSADAAKEKEDQENGRKPSDGKLFPTQREEETKSVEKPRGRSSPSKLGGSPKTKTLETALPNSESSSLHREPKPPAKPPAAAQPKRPAPSEKQNRDQPLPAIGAAAKDPLAGSGNSIRSMRSEASTSGCSGFDGLLNQSEVEARAEEAAHADEDLTEQQGHAATKLTVLNTTKVSGAISDPIVSIVEPIVHPSRQEDSPSTSQNKAHGSSTGSGSISFTHTYNPKGGPGSSSSGGDSGKFVPRSVTSSGNTTTLASSVQIQEYSLQLSQQSSQGGPPSSSGATPTPATTSPAKGLPPSMLATLGQSGDTPLVMNPNQTAGQRQIVADPFGELPPLPSTSPKKHSIGSKESSGEYDDADTSTGSYKSVTSSAFTNSNNPEGNPLVFEDNVANPVLFISQNVSNGSTNSGGGSSGTDGDQTLSPPPLGGMQRLPSDNLAVDLKPSFQSQSHIVRETFTTTTTTTSGSGEGFIKTLERKEEESLRQQEGEEEMSIRHGVPPAGAGDSVKESSNSLVSAEMDDDALGALISWIPQKPASDSMVASSPLSVKPNERRKTLAPSDEKMDSTSSISSIKSNSAFGRSESMGNKSSVKRRARSGTLAGRDAAAHGKRGFFGDERQTSTSHSGVDANAQLSISHSTHLGQAIATAPQFVNSETGRVQKTTKGRKDKSRRKSWGAVLAKGSSASGQGAPGSGRSEVGASMSVSGAFTGGEKWIPEKAWLLVRVYARIKFMVKKWKFGHSVMQNDRALVVLSRHDTRDWHHIFVCEALELNDRPIGGGRIHISGSHFYLNVESDLAQGTRFSFTARLSDLSSVVPSDEEGWIDVTYCAVPNALIETEDQDAASKQATTELNFLRIKSAEAAAIGVHLFEEKAQILMKYVRSFAVAMRAQEEMKTLEIVHFNDVYHLPPFKPPGAKIVGGASRFHTRLSELRETMNPLVLFSGDFMGPSLMSVITKGKQMVDALNFLGVHYGVLGNHEFDFGLKQLKEVLHGYSQGKHVYPGSQTTWLMSNMTEGDGSTPLGNTKKRALFTWNNVRVGLLGLCEDWLPQCAYLHPHEAKYFDVFESGERMAKELKEEGAEVVFALSHCRLPVDRQITELCPSIDYLLGGHDHFYRNEPRNRLVKSGQEFEYLTRVRVEFFPGETPKIRTECELITSDIPESPYMEGLINRYEAKMAEKLGKRIGRSEIELDSTEERVRFKEGHLTNFVLDVMEKESECDFAVLGAAAVAGKDVKPPGFITIGDVFNWFPNETRIMQVRMKGSTISKMLNAMVREVPAEAPSFPHPSKSLNFTINLMKKPTPECEYITIKGKPLDPEKHYMVAVEEFVGNGKAKYKMVGQEGQVIVNSENAPQLVNWVLDSFSKSKAQSSQKEARIKSVVKVVSSATHLGVDMDMYNSQKFIRSLICELLQCDRSAVFLVDNDTNELHFFPDGMDKEIRFPKNKGLAGHVACEMEILCIADVYDDPRFNQAVDKSTGYRTKSMLACPVVIDGGLSCAAVVQAINKDPKVNESGFDETDAVVLTFLGEQLGYQMYNNRIYNQAKKEPSLASYYEGEEGEVTLTALKNLVSLVTTDLENGQKNFTQSAVDLIQSEVVRVIHIREEDSTEYIYLDNDYGEQTEVVVPLENGTAFERCVNQQESVIVENASQEAILTKENDISTLHWRSALLVPLVTPAKKTVGAILWVNKKRGIGFEDSDAMVGSLFGRMVGASVQNLLRIIGLDLNNEQNVPQLPEPDVGRIGWKGGWYTVRQLVKQHKVPLLRSMAWKDQQEFLFSITENPFAREGLGVLEKSANVAGGHVSMNRSMDNRPTLPSNTSESQLVKNQSFLRTASSDPKQVSESAAGGSGKQLAKTAAFFSKILRGTSWMPKSQKDETHRDSLTENPLQGTSINKSPGSRQSPSPSPGSKGLQLPPKRKQGSPQPEQRNLSPASAPQKTSILSGTNAQLLANLGIRPSNSTIMPSNSESIKELSGPKLTIPPSGVSAEAAEASVGSTNSSDDGVKPSLFEFVNDI